MNKEIMEQAGFKEHVENFEASFCPHCKDKINMKDFRDDLSIKEYWISGLDQKCQDEVFGC